MLLDVTLARCLLISCSACLLSNNKERREWNGNDTGIKNFRRVILGDQETERQFCERVARVGRMQCWATH